MMHRRQPKSPLHRFFAGMAEYAFQSRLGMADPPLIDYISDLLTRYVRMEMIYSIRDLSGRRLEDVVEMLTEATARIGNAQREVHRHIGDFTLFWTGVYPEALQRMRGPRKMDHFVDYCAQGKRSYYIASTIQTDGDQNASGEVLERLSHQFEQCAYGLREVRREWERRDDGPDKPLWLATN